MTNRGSCPNHESHRPPRPRLQRRIVNLFEGSRQRKRRRAEQEQFALFIDGACAWTNEIRGFSPEEKSAIAATLANLKTDHWEAESFHKVSRRLKATWEPSQPMAFRKSSRRERQAESPSPPTDATVHYSARYHEESQLRETPSSNRNWLIVMSKDFLKSVHNIDRKLQGRVLEAIGEICQNPLTARGDTVKPLSQEMRGQWRYRLGDFRLIYQPVPDRQQVILLMFDDRGSIYS